MEGKFGFAVFLVLCTLWQVEAQVNCTATGAGRFAEPTDTTCKNYTLCVASGTTFLSYNYVCPTTSLFNPISRLCTTNYTCTATTTNTTNSVCTAEGFFADPSSTTCSSYIECVLINGAYVQTTFSCPAGTLYNPTTTLCETNYICTATFTCSSAGRFANTADTTCQTYYFCVLQTNGTFAQFAYTCPTTSVFNPTSRLCTTSYICT